MHHFTNTSGTYATKQIKLDSPFGFQILIISMAIEEISSCNNLMALFLQLQESSIPYQRKMEMSREKKEDKNLAQGDTGQQPFPQTSAQVIGWKSTNATAHSYGIQESRARRKCDFLQVLQWPYEGM